MSNQKANSSVTSGILRVDQLLENLDKITFDEPVVNKYGGKSCRVRLNGKDIIFQFPRSRLAFGLGKYDEKDKNGQVIKTKYSLDFSLAGYELGEDGKPISPKMRIGYDVLVGLREVLIKAAMENSASWLDMDDATEQLAKALTRDTLKFSKDKVTKKPSTKWAPTFHTKLGFWEGRFTVNAYDENKTKITDIPSALTAGCEAIPIVKITGVNFAGGKVGYSFRCEQLKVYPAKGLSSYAFLEEDEEDSKPVASRLQNKSTSEDEKEEVTEVNNTVEDSESEDELDNSDSESEEEERVPTPPPAKKVRKTKAKK
uniref:Uncharacterized protein n=1 Tax=viral metagenome TaxID=1070528 RepID=A0A6C0JCR0_9ZZZZ